MHESSSTILHLCLLNVLDAQYSAQSRSSQWLDHGELKGLSLTPMHGPDYGVAKRAICIDTLGVSSLDTF